MRQGQMQLGKNGVTEEFIQALKAQFATRESIRVSILKSATRDRKELEEVKSKILDGLGKNYTAKVIGFTLVVKKWRKPKRD